MFLKLYAKFCSLESKYNTTTTGAKMVTVPKTSTTKMNVPVVKVPNSGQVSMKTTKTSPQTSVMKVGTGKPPPKKTFVKGTKGPQVSGSNPYGPSENN